MEKAPLELPKATRGGAPGPQRPEARLSARERRYELYFLSPRTRAYVGKILKKISPP